MLGGFLLFSPNAAADTFKRTPANGEDAVCYDISADGNILRLDYAQQKMTVLGTVPLKGSSPDICVYGAIAPDGRAAWLLFQTLKANWTHSALHHFDMAEQNLRAAGHTIETAGDFAMVAASSMAFYCAETPSEPALLVRKTADGFEKLTAKFTFGGWRIFSTAPGGALFLRPNAYGPGYLCIQTGSGSVVRHGTAEVLWGRQDVSRVGISNICGNYGLVGCGASDGTRLCAIQNLETNETIAVIPNVPEGEAEACLHRIGRETLAIDVFCGAHNITTKEFQYSGLVRRYVVDLKKKSFSGPEEFNFEPATQLMLRVGTELRSCPRHHFGYVGMRDFAHGVQMDTPLETWDDRTRRIDLLRSRLAEKQNE